MMHLWSLAKQPSGSGCNIWGGLSVGMARRFLLLGFCICSAADAAAAVENVSKNTPQLDPQSFHAIEYIVLL